MVIGLSVPMDFEDQFYSRGLYLVLPLPSGMPAYSIPVDLPSCENSGSHFVCQMWYFLEATDCTSFAGSAV